MRTPEVAVIDYGVGNLLSVRRGLEQCGANVIVTGDPDAILASPRVVLPGVGAFASGMAGLQSAGLDQVTREVAARGTPLLAICLGMQMLMDESEEFGSTPGLGLIAGRVIPVPAIDSKGNPQKLPHIGWVPLVKSNGTARLLAGIGDNEAVYFVHSFMANPADEQHRIADCRYGGRRVSAMVGRDNITGCQFHPEKSGAVGLKVLRNFLAS